MKTKLYLLCGLLCDATVWQKQVPILSKMYDVKVFDFLGFDDLTAMAKHLLADAQEPFVLIAHSMGARVALEVMRLAPERVLQLALLDTGVHGVKEGEAEKRHALLTQAQEQGIAYLVDAWLMPMLAPAKRLDNGITEPLVQMILNAKVEHFAKHIHALLNRPDTQAGLNNIDCDVLLGVGLQDTWSPVSQHEAIKQLVPQAQLVIFDEGGHMAPFEDAERVNQALLQWLQPQTVREHQEAPTH